MLIYNFYQIFGQIVIIIALSILGLLTLTLILGGILIRENKLIFPKVLLFTLDVFYGFLRKFSENLGVDSKIVDQIGVEVRNKVNEKRFKKLTTKDKILVLPHCLRHSDCEANLETSGLVCTNCNRCVIGVLKDKGEDLGYQVFIIPGSTFLKKIIEENNFKAVLGVACYQDLNLAMMKLNKFSCQGIPLLRDGCVNTKVDYRAVLEKMGVEIEKKIEINKDNSCNKKSYSDKLL